MCHKYNMKHLKCPLNIQIANVLQFKPFFFVIMILGFKTMNAHITTFIAQFQFVCLDLFYIQYRQVTKQ